jgi:hypothetical protein
LEVEFMEVGEQSDEALLDKLADETLQREQTLGGAPAVVDAEIV